MTTAEKMKRLRKHHKLTQQKMAALLKITRNHYSNLETGARAYTETVCRCASFVFHVDEKWLLDETDGDLSPVENSYLIEYRITTEQESRLEATIEKLKTASPERMELALKMLDVILNTKG